MMRRGCFLKPSAFETLRIYADGQPYENPEGLALWRLSRVLPRQWDVCGTHQNNPVITHRIHVYMVYMLTLVVY